MPARRSTLLIATFTLFFLGSFAHADWPPITPDQLALTSVSQHPGAPAVVLSREERDDDVQHYHSVYVRIKILTEAGRRYADVELPYNRARAGFMIDSISGRTVHADGTVIPFEGKPFQKTVMKGKGVKWLVKAFTLPDVRPGSIIDYRYSLRYHDNYAVPPEWMVQEELFQKQVSFTFVPSRRDLVLEHGRIGRGVAWTTYLPAQYKVEEHINPISYSITLAATDIAPLIEEPHMPPESALRLRVRFYYRSGWNKDFWADEGKFWGKDVESFLSKKKGISEALAGLIAPGDTSEQKLRKIYAFVSKMENRSYLPAREAQEIAALGMKLNEGVEDVLRQRSADHDDLNRLFVALAREAGFPAWMMLVPSRDDNFFDEAFLSMQQFDGEIAIVQVDGKEKYFDPGSKFCPFGLMEWRYSGSKGLRESAKGTEIGEAPLPVYNQALIKRVAKLTLAEDGTAQGPLGVGFFGIEGMIRRQSAGKTDAEGRKKALEDEVKHWLPAGSEVTLTNTPAWDDGEAPLVAQFTIKAPVAVTAGKKWLFAPHVFQSNDKPMFSAAQRMNAIYLYYPWREIDDIKITLPSSFEVDSLPAKRSIETDYAIYHADDKQDKNVVISSRDLAVGSIAFAAKEYSDVKGFYDKVKTGDDAQVIVKGAARASN